MAMKFPDKSAFGYTVGDITRLFRRVFDRRSAHLDLTRAQWPITTARQFPTLTPELPPDKRRRDLAAGLGVVVFEGPQGPGFFKGGHNNGTGNTWVCLDKRRSCAVLLSNDVRAETIFPDLVRLLLGETGTPWDWEYGR